MKSSNCSAVTLLTSGVVERRGSWRLVAEWHEMLPPVPESERFDPVHLPPSDPNRGQMARNRLATRWGCHNLF